MTGFRQRTDPREYSGYSPFVDYTQFPILPEAFCRPKALDCFYLLSIQDRGKKVKNILIFCIRCSVVLQ